MQSLLVTQGIKLKIKRALGLRLDGLTLWDGRALPGELKYGAVGTVIAKTTALLVHNVLFTYIVWSKLVDEIPENVEFGIDLRTGHPIITQPESLERLIQCFFVGPIEHWGNPTFVSEAAGNLLSRYAEPIEVPEKSHLYAWGWIHELPEPIPS
jgi:hypothetical protein